MGGQATDVFLSYKAEDRSRLTSLVSALEAEGFTVWWDAHIGGGSNWREDIQEHLDAAKCVIVAWTKRSVGREGNFVRDEAARAQRRGVYLPVRLDDVEPPLGFGEVQALSLRGWKGDRADARFRSVADAVRRHVTGEPVSQTPAAPSALGLSRRTVIGGSIGAVAVAAGAGFLLLKPAAANGKRIAVLPFANLSGDPGQNFFSDGIAEELRSALSRVGMEVIGRTSSEAIRDMDAKDAAGKLNVANILTGSVRRSPQTIRVSAQLVSGKDGVEKWAQSYDRAPGDSISIQTDIASNVAEALSLVLGQAGRAALTIGGTADSIAQDLILQSRQIRSQSNSLDSYRRRLALADQAIARDPQYADAYVERSDMLGSIAIQYGRTPVEVTDQLGAAASAAKKAAELAPRLATAYSSLGSIASYRLHFAEGLALFQKSLALAPNDAQILRDVARIFSSFRTLDEALRLNERAIALDPFNHSGFVNKALFLQFAGRYEEGLAAGRKALELAPTRRGTHTTVGECLLLMNRFDEAKAEFDAGNPGDPFRLSRLALLAAKKGDRAGAERIMGELKAQQGVTYSYQYAEIRAMLGDIDQAFAELDNAVRATDPGLSDLKCDPFLAAIRTDPRFDELVTRLRFP